MSLHKIFNVSLRIILLFAIAIALSFIPDYNHEFFGDWICEGSKKYGWFHYTGCTYGSGGYHNPSLHWGYRHWLFSLMGLSLSVMQVVAIILLINKK